MDHGCPYACTCLPLLVLPPWSHSHTCVLCSKVTAGRRELEGRTEATCWIEGEKAGIQNHFIVENTKGDNFNKCQMVKINQRRVEPYMSNCLLWQRFFSFSNKSLPGALFFSLAFLFPFAHPLDSSSHPTLLLLWVFFLPLLSHCCP